MTLLTTVSAALIGLSLGLLGGGGSILTVPVFVYLLGFAAKPAIAMSLPVVGITSLSGTIGHFRAGNLHVRTALVFGLFTMTGAFLGARLSVYVSGTAQLILLSVVMVVAAISMFRSSFRKTQGSSVSSNSDTDTPQRLWVLPLVGLCVGILTGIIGIGGGFLIVPALVLFAKVPMRQAVGTSLLVITLTTTAGYAGYAGQFDIPWELVSYFAAIAVGGSLVGVMLSQKLSSAILKRAFAGLLIVIGLLMLYQNTMVTPQG